MKNHKGLLLPEETSKAILAVIGIGLLAFLLFSIYKNEKDSKDLDFAKESLDFMAKELNAKSSEITVYNPKGWNIGTWPHDVEVGFILKTVQFQYPKSCSNLGWNKCICICKEDNAESCDSNGICLNTEEKFQIDGGNIEMTNPPVTLEINYPTKKISEA